MLLSTLAAIAAPSQVWDLPEPLPVPFEAPGHPLPIVGGAEAPLGAWPDVVAIYTINDTFGCTGTLIAPDLVLTAGHCGFGMESVRVGTQDLREGGTYIPIAATWVYPDYFSTLDVAVYQLAAPAEGIVARGLLLDCLAYDGLYEGGDAVIVGFGDIDTYATVSTDVLHEAVVRIQDPICANPANACNPAVSPGGEFIAGGDGVDTCNGDSGGPIFVDTPDGFLLAGVTSRAAQPNTMPCGDGGIYPRADGFAAWIESQTGVVFERPECPDINRPPSPSALPIEVIEGGLAGKTTIRANDPDDGQTHSFRIQEAPAEGLAWIDGDSLVFQPDRSSSGDQQVTVQVTDNGTPASSAELVVPITVLQVRVVTTPAKGCHTAPMFVFSQLARALSRRSSDAGSRTRSGSTSP